VANLVITTVCNQSCEYCFTADHLEYRQRTDDGAATDSVAPSDRWTERTFLPASAFQDRLDFLARSGIEEVRLLGGEPTLHPDFADLVKRARTAGMRVVVFTNGLMPQTAIACLEAIEPEACTVMVNVNQPTGDDDAHRRRCDTICRLGERVLPGFNIYRPDFQPDFLLPMIAETGCKPVIRLGMAQPCLSGRNHHVHPNQYRAIAVKIVRFARSAADAGVTLDFDCGFVRCMFSDTDLETLQASGAKFGWWCSPILDVDIEGNIIHCFPLARLASQRLTPGTDATTLRSTFEAWTRPYRQAGVFKECSTCPLKTQGRERDTGIERCSGGCLAMTIRRFRRTSFALEVPADVRDLGVEAVA
jgi:hypothetical protein